MKHAAAGAVLLACLSVPALAALGGDARSVEVDRAQLKGEVSVSTGAGFTVHEITLPTRTVIREYLSPAGTIFAVTWRGQVVPDLRQTLGSYYPAFRAAVDSAPRGPDHRHLSVEKPELVVHSSGRMRDHRGVVYVPALLPPGVSPNDLR
jgi:hypothetical protein